MTDASESSRFTPKNSRRYPPPKILNESLGEYHVGWVGHPYYVKVSNYSTIYLSIDARKGYRRPCPLERGSIATTNTLTRAQRLLKRFLRIAWKKNRRASKHALPKTDIHGVFDAVGVQK